MKKIMFNDKYRLTQAVLDGRKTQTRRIVTFCGNLYNKALKYYTLNSVESFKKALIEFSPYQVGEEVAVAQSYKSVADKDHNFCIPNAKGFFNKMFVRADLMPHRIKITNISVERLQDISEEDCIKEGVREHKGMTPEKYPKKWSCFTCNGLGVRREKYFEDTVFFTGREAFAALIDKVSGKGTWESNPYVFVYDFELIR